MATILVVKLGALGDLVQADGALRDIRENHPEDLLAVMTTTPYRRYMDRCPWIDEVFIDPRASRFNLLQMVKLRKRLYLRNFDCVYDLQQVGRTRFYYRWLFPATRWIGDVPGCSVYLKRNEERTCAAEHFAEHLRSAGLKVRYSLTSDVAWMAEDATRILSAAGIKPGFVVLFPGASISHDHKRWPHFRELARRLQRAGKEVVTVPGPDEITLCQGIPGKTLVPEGGYYDIFKLAGIVKQASFVIGNDTGPTHIAAHLGLAGIALFGGHVGPFSTGIQHTGFAIMESTSLSELPLDRVWQQVETALADQIR
jgi:ADP-heptose:LPS heptosyltransferase